MKRLRTLFRLLLDFLRMGAFTFGGGWSIVAQMRETYVQDRKCLRDEELLDMVSLGRSLPGIMGCNVALLYGYRAAGFFGGVICILGMILPPLLVLIGIRFFYEAVRTNQWVVYAMSGMRAAVVPIIISAARNMIKGSFRFPPCYAVAVVVFLLYIWLHVSCVWLTLFGLCAGIAISEYYERRGGPCQDAS